jgi:ABC-type amino acid transport substrate-binding protein
LRPLLVAVLAAHWPAAASTIEMAYPDENGIAQGPGHFAFDFLRAAELIVNDSGLTVAWVPMPVARMIHQIQVGQQNFCVAGAGVTSERAATGQFTKPFINDRLLAVVALKSQKDHLSQAHDFSELIAQGKENFIGYQGANYGDAIAPQLDKLKGRIAFVPRNTEQMLDMLERSRADYGLAMKTYLTNYLTATGESDRFVVASYPDMHRDFRTAFLCSRSVPGSVIETLNAALDRQLPKIREMFPEQRLDVN